MGGLEGRGKAPAVPAGRVLEGVDRGVQHVARGGGRSGGDAAIADPVVHHLSREYMVGEGELRLILPPPDLPTISVDVEVHLRQQLLLQGVGGEGAEIQAAFRSVTLATSPTFVLIRP